MSDLPEGWDDYDPDNHDRSAEPDYKRARAVAAERAERRRVAYGRALAALRRARLVTQVALAQELGVAQGEVSRIEHQADLLLSTLARYVDGMGGELALLVRFADLETVELSPSLSELGEESTSSEAVAEFRRYQLKEANFRAGTAA
jgi:transcriptional regulator with XRE-family HTH domain